MSYGSRRLASQFVLPPHRRSRAKGSAPPPGCGDSGHAIRRGAACSAG